MTESRTDDGGIEIAGKPEKKSRKVQHTKNSLEIESRKLRANMGVWGIWRVKL
jgi:hypothetical protein